MTTTILLGDCREVLATLPAGSVHTVVTSPPYYALRSYLDASHADKHREIGLEATPEAFVQQMVEVFRAIRRVMRDDAVAFVNLGDSYQDKQLLGMPWRVAFALQADGWWLRSAIVWAKPNPMPESVKGSHVSRHMITLSEYERLSGMPHSGERAGTIRTCDVPSLPASEVSGREASVSAERQGAGDSQSTRGTAGCAGEAPAIRSFSARAEEQGEIREDGEGKGYSAQAVGQVSRETRGESQGGGQISGKEERSWRNSETQEGRCSLQADSQRQGAEVSAIREAQGSDSSDIDAASDGCGVASDSAEGEGSLFLLWGEGKADAGSRHAAEQGRSSQQDQRGSGMSAVQLEEEQPADPAPLVECPGCSKCVNGYIVHLSAGRPTSSYEMVFLLSKRATYFYDAEAVREPHTGPPPEHYGVRLLPKDRDCADANVRLGEIATGAAREYNPAGRNARNVWTIATEAFPSAHFATFPTELASRCIRAGTSERGCCAQCGAPWVRTQERGPAVPLTPSDAGRKSTWTIGDAARDPASRADTPLPRHYRPVLATGWSPSCAHNADVVPATVLDPFGGAGTVGLVADRLGRDAVLVELSEAYCAMARDRISGEVPLFADVSTSWPPAETDAQDERMADLFAWAAD